MSNRFPPDEGKRRVLAVLGALPDSQPATIVEIAQRAGMSQDPVRRILIGLVDDGAAERHRVVRPGKQVAYGFQFTATGRQQWDTNETGA